MAARVMGALVFVALLVGVLAVPILQSDDGPARPNAGRSSAEPTPSSEPEGAANVRSDRRWFHSPVRCDGSDKPAIEPDRDLVAAASRTGVALVHTDGQLVARLDASRPVALSVSGTVATGRNGALWFSDGSPMERGEVQLSLGERLSAWGWSPVSDCAATIDNRGAMSLRAYRGIPPGASVQLFESGVESFAFSPIGRWIAVVVRHRRDTELWLVNLRANKIRLLKTFSTMCCVTLGGWTPNDSVLHWAGPGVSVMADGWPLRSLFVVPRPATRVATTLPRPDVLVRCGRRILAIDLEERFDDAGDLRTIYPRRSTHTAGNFSSATCSETGTATVAASDVGPRSHLVLLRANGGSVLTDDPAYSDTWPEWGPAGTGVLFLRHPIGAAAYELWFIPEGGAPKSLDVRLDQPRPNYRELPWRRALDWSATPPDGLPAG